MGNWRTVQIIGTCGADDVEALREVLAFDHNTTSTEDWDKFGPLSVSIGICGIPMWAREQFDVIGNLAERDYDPESVAEHLRKVVEKAPSLKVKIHCGNDYEEKDCIATVVAEDGKVEVREAEIENIPEIPPGQMESNLLSAMMKRT